MHNFVFFNKPGKYGDKKNENDERKKFNFKTQAGHK